MCLQLADTDTELIKTAKDAAGKAYAPYSHFQVGAALLCSDGRVFTGCNIENASYSLTMCAERVALYKAVSEGVKDFCAIAIITASGDEALPCGACLQVLQELAPHIKIIVEEEGRPKSFTLDKLLPYPFCLKESSKE